MTVTPEFANCLTLAETCESQYTTLPFTTPGAKKRTSVLDSAVNWRILSAPPKLLSKTGLMPETAGQLPVKIISMKKALFGRPGVAELAP